MKCNARVEKSVEIAVEDAVEIAVEIAPKRRGMAEEPEMQDGWRSGISGLFTRTAMQCQTLV